MWSCRSQAFEFGAEGNDTARIECLDRIIATLDVVDADRLADAGDRQHAIEVTAKSGIIDEPPQVALEEAVVGGVEADKRDEQPHIGLRQPIAEEERTSAGEPLLEFV
jgi:hypothetical protein